MHGDMESKNSKIMDAENTFNKQFVRGTLRSRIFMLVAELHKTKEIDGDCVLKNSWVAIVSSVVNKFTTMMFQRLQPTRRSNVTHGILSNFDLCSVLPSPTSCRC